MDLGSLLGIAAGVGVLVWALVLGGSVRAFWNVPSLMITFGGTFAATFISYPMSQVLGVVKVLRRAFAGKSLDATRGIDLLVNLAQKARKSGILSLEEDAEHVEDEFLKRGLMLVIDGVEPAVVRKILETEIDFLAERHRMGQALFETMGSFAPAFGMIGTLIGLIQMLRKLTDPSSLGPGMAMALVTTFYGAIAANLLFLPIAGKLKVKSAQEILVKSMLLEGILAMQAGENPRLIEDKLRAYLSPNERNHRDLTRAKEEAKPVGQDAASG